MDTRQATALAGELETTLGLLQDLVAELSRVRADWSGIGRIQELLVNLRGRPNLDSLPHVFLAAYTAISEALSGIRITREAIHSHTVERLHESHSKLSEVSSATESATMEMMNGLERTLGIVTEIEQGASIDTAACQRLREEVNQMFNHLQFQDITAQQLAGVSQFLDEIEIRIAGVVGQFDSALEQSAAGPPRIDSRGLAFNPDASSQHDTAKQAVIDAAFGGRTADSSGRIPA